MCEHQKQEVCGEQVCGVCYGEQMLVGPVPKGPKGEYHPEPVHELNPVGRRTPEESEDFWRRTYGVGVMDHPEKVYSDEERSVLWRRWGHRVDEL